MSSILMAILVAMLGGAFLLVGYRFFLVMLPIWGFFAGFWIGAMAISLLLGDGFLATTTGLVVGFVAGIIGAIVSYLFYIVGVLIISAAMGGMVASGMMSALGFDPGLITTIVIVVSALVAAGLTLLLDLQKYVIIVFSSIAGALLLVMSGMLLLGQVTMADLQSGVSVFRPLLQGYWYWGLVAIGLAVAGVVVQIRTSSDYVWEKEMYVEGWH